ncbi:MAG: NADH-quinone oxidoreductase subunit NuoF [Candidatus Cloacimonetes bacterium]|nr:NADH-quinone oxidoreductase subunit NuoF [Candidatus Cloacimonadota bacterium]MDD3501937.1 NADH-quinone oxidoreductase subunit NuoF [Candidatus Cloacimonadota bacterium]
MTDTYRKIPSTFKWQVAMCKGTGCQATGEISLKTKFDQLIKEKGLEKDIHIIETGCRGFCEMGPIIEIFPEKVFYVKVKPEHVEDIIEKTLKKGEIINELVFQNTPIADEINFYKKQTRRVLGSSGLIDAENINDAVAAGSYFGLKRSLFEMTPEEVVEEVKKAGLRGRGGGGFLTGIKWGLTAKQDDPIKFVVCNADEGDPGAFMDRSILEGDPHKIIEGMSIAAYAVGASQGYVYVRAEYPLAIQRLQEAIEQATEVGFLGNNIMGKDFHFSLKIAQGAGAFVCGEESALIASIEGKRGMPTPKPPFPAERGLFDKPTNINNVETYASVPLILKNGYQWYSSVGTDNNRGTKIFALSGKISNTGLVEVPMGITLREIIYEIGGGIKDGKKFKAAQIGGPSGGCLTEAHLDMPVDFDSLQKAGAMVGSGGLVVLDETTCMVEISRYFMSFTQDESCGKCIPCRVGTKQMLEIMTKIVSGESTMDDLKTLEELAVVVKNASLCGLGKTAPNPILSTINHFRDEYIAHIVDKRCPAGECQSLRQFHIDPIACKGCTKCARVCPTGSIIGAVKEPHEILQDKCIKCGACMSACPFGAISVS